MSKKLDIKKMVTMSMLCAMAYTVTVVFRISVVPGHEYLKYDLKDVVLLIGGFLYGPLYAFMMSVVVSVLEMLSVSADGWVGCIMNIVSSCSLICTASFVYSKRKTLGGAILGLVIGVVAVTGMMTLWNYIVTPLYRGFPRSVVVPLLLPVFAAFNFFKGGLNAIISVLLFKPIVSALHKAELIEPPIVGTRSTVMKWVFIGVGAAVAITVLFAVLKFDLSLFASKGD